MVYTMKDISTTILPFSYWYPFRFTPLCFQIWTKESNKEPFETNFFDSLNLMSVNSFNVHNNLFKTELWYVKIWNTNIIKHILILRNTFIHGWKIHSLSWKLVPVANSVYKIVKYISIPPSSLIQHSFLFQIKCDSTFSIQHFILLILTIL